LLAGFASTADISVQPKRPVILSELHGNKRPLNYPYRRIQWSLHLHPVR
jgi:hypothetical protein